MGCLSKQSLYSNMQIKSHILFHNELELCSSTSRGFSHMAVNKRMSNEKYLGRVKKDKSADILKTSIYSYINL